MYGLFVHTPFTVKIFITYCYNNNLCERNVDTNRSFYRTKWCTLIMAVELYFLLVKSHISKMFINLPCSLCTIMSV